jgi:hypothetical protein
MGHADCGGKNAQKYPVTDSVAIHRHGTNFTMVGRRVEAPQLLKGQSESLAVHPFGLMYALMTLAILALKGQSHEKVYEFLTWVGSFSLN